MSKRLMRMAKGIILLFLLAFVAVVVYDNDLQNRRDIDNPNNLGSYSDSGYYKIDPETILASLERGDANVFKPLREDPSEIEELDVDISWAQDDFLQTASALGQFVWDDPMDLEDWNVYYISFSGSCDDPIGFNSARITYFVEGRKRYATRLIEIDPYWGWVRWGDGETYPKPILQKWNSVNLLEAKITAGAALQIASKDAKTRYHFENQCGVIMSSPQNNDHENWHLKLFGASDLLKYTVNLDTGEYAHFE